MSGPRLLHGLVPALDSRLRPVDLVTRPTPVTPAPDLARAWGLASLQIKRDDLTSPAYGGSKVRNLEYFLGQALAGGATGVATMGPYGSHQVLATAIHAPPLGLATRAILTPQPDNAEGRLNQRLLPQLGMEVVRCGGFAAVPLAYVKARLARLGGRWPYWIPPGSAHPVGVLGIIEGALELAADVRTGKIECPDDVVVPTGTCATAAGVLLGLAMAGLRVRVVAVRMVPMIVTGPGKLMRMVAATRALLAEHGYHYCPPLGELLWVDDFAGPGYGLARPEVGAVAEQAAALGGLRTDVTYTAKTLAMLHAGILSGRRVLFWNTLTGVEPQGESVDE